MDFSINTDRIFPFGLIALGLFFLYSSFWLWKLDETNISSKEKLARNKLLGTILAAIGLLWCTLHSKPLLPNSMQSYLIPTAIFCTWASYMFLDYLFSRAFGGMLILLAHFFLYESFALKTPGKILFSLLCFAMGTYGIFLCGKPYLLRDAFRKISHSRNWKLSCVILMLLYSLSFISYGIIHLL